MSLHIPVDIAQVSAGGVATGTIVQANAPRRIQQDMKGDAERTAGALRGTVEAESQFRSIVDTAQPGKVQDAARQFGKVPHSALAGTADPLEQAALIGQLDQSMAFHEDRLALRAMQDRAQEMAQLRDERMKGMLLDASDAGSMTGAASSPELQQRALMHFSNSILSMEQTFRATGKVLGEDDKAIGERIRVSRSGMTGAFIARMAQGNPSHANALLGQLGNTLEESDRTQVREAVTQSLQDRAITSLETVSYNGQQVDYEDASKRLDANFRKMGLDEKGCAAVRDRLEISRARQAYQKGKADEEQRKKTFGDFYGSVDSGDVVAAHRLLDSDTVLSESQRSRMRQSLKAEKWVTAPESFLKIFTKMESGELDNALEIIPGSSLSNKDAVLLRDALKVDEPRAAMEKRLLFQSAKTVLDAMDGEKEERKAEAVRTLFGVVSQARQKGTDPTVLFTSGKDGNVIDHMLSVYGGSKDPAGKEEKAVKTV